MSALKNQIRSYDQIDVDGIVTALKKKGYRIERNQATRFGELIDIIELKDLDEKFELRFKPQYGGTVDVMKYPTGTILLTDKRTNKTLTDAITTHYVRTQNNMVRLIKEALLGVNHPTDQGWREYARKRLNDYENTYLKDRPNAFKYYVSIAQKEVDEESNIPKTPDTIKRKYGGNKFHLHGKPFTSQKAAMEAGLKKEGEGHVCFIEPFGSKFTLYISELKVRIGDRNLYPLKPSPQQHPQAKKAAYVKAYERRHAAFEQDAASKDIFGLTPREKEGYERHIEGSGRHVFGKEPDEYYEYMTDEIPEESLVIALMQKPRAPARKKPAPKKAAAPRKPKAPAKKARTPAKKPATRKQAVPKKPISKPTGRPQVLKASTTQTGKSDKKRDAARKAMAPGKRSSATGRIYYEYRKNRSDVRGRKT